YHRDLPPFPTRRSSDLAGVVLTVLYMTRQIIYVFFGQTRSSSGHAHESPAVMTMPLIALALCAIFFSVVLTPAWPWLHAYLTGRSEEHTSELQSRSDLV